MLNIIHGADFHLDSPFSGLSPERAAQRRGEQRDLLPAWPSWPGRSRPTWCCCPAT